MTINDLVCYPKNPTKFNKTGFREILLQDFSQFLFLAMLIYGEAHA